MRKQCSAVAQLLLASLAVVAAYGVGVQAADYPHKPIRVIVPFSPGGGSDVIARLVGARLSERVAQTLVVDKLYQEITAIARTPDVRRMLVSQGNEVITNTPAEFARLVAATAEKWGTVGERLGVKLD